MRYRALDADGDMAFGSGQANFLINSSEAVAQSVLTRLQLHRGEWFLDTKDGLPLREVLGSGTRPTYDNAIRKRILGTTGVTQITSYSSTLIDRRLTVQASLDTVYGPITVKTVFTA